MRRTIPPMVAAAIALTFAACEDDVPTGVTTDLFPVSPRTVELLLPWSSFADNVRVLGGFGSPFLLGPAVAAHEFEGGLEARILARFGGFPDSAAVQVDGANVRSAVNYVGGRLFLRIDTLTSTRLGPVTVVARTLDTPWDPASASWSLAVDTLNEERPWPVPGGGPADSVSFAVWSPLASDTLVIELDSAVVADWRDSTDVTRGVRLDVWDRKTRVQVNSLILRLDAVPELDPDTVLERIVGAPAMTFIYDPTPEPPADELRIGGVPAWRTFVDVDVPRVITGPADVCERVECPFTLEADKINAASLVLRSRATDPAFRPADSVRLDIRPVLAPDRIPKAPLGSSLVGGAGRAIAADAFGAAAGQEVPMPLAGFVRDQVRGETLGGASPDSTIALLSFFEPSSFSFANFGGPGAEDEPFLRLIVTLTDTVQIR